MSRGWNRATFIEEDGSWLHIAESRIQVDMLLDGYVEAGYRVRESWTEPGYPNVPFAIVTNEDGERWRFMLWL